MKPYVERFLKMKTCNAGVKTFEECQRGSLSALVDHYTAHPPRGEVVIMIGAGTAVVWDDATVDAALVEHLSRMGPSEASAAVAKLSGIAKRALYQKALALKASVSEE